MIDRFVTTAAAAGLAGAAQWASQARPDVAAVLLLLSVGLIAVRLIGLDRVDDLVSNRGVHS